MPERLLIDTHIIVDISGTGGLDALPTKVRRMLQDPEIELLLSTISITEIAIKGALGKLKLTKPELELVCANASIKIIPLLRQHVDRLFDLPLHHKDPFDRLLIATALSESVPVISADQQFRKYRGLRVIW